jgi:DNA-binding response OmpR family regulator
MVEKRILVVEDEPDIRDLLCHVLRAEGYRVDGAATLAEAKSRLATARYSVVFADWRLPDGDGTVVAAWAKQLGAKTFVMSGYLFQMPGGRALDHETLMKPLRPSEILDVVERNIGKASV